MNLYLDLETIPTQDPDVRAQIAESVTPPGNITKAESIDKWNEEKRPAAVEKAIADTALDGTYGHVCCIGLAVDDSDPMSYNVEDVTDEARVLDHVLGGIKPLSLSPIVVIGHNVIGFDLRFLWQRAIILGVKMPHWFPRDPKPWGDDVFDTMLAFAGQRNTIGLDRLCRALGLGGKGDMDGSKVAALWEAGEHDRIAEHCRSDVERVRNVHRRMQIAFGEYDYDPNGSPKDDDRANFEATQA